SAHAVPGTPECVFRPQAERERSPEQELWGPGTGPGPQARSALAEAGVQVVDALAVARMLRRLGTGATDDLMARAVAEGVNVRGLDSARQARIEGGEAADALARTRLDEDRAVRVETGDGVVHTGASRLVGIEAVVSECRGCEPQHRGDSDRSAD